MSSGHIIIVFQTWQEPLKTCNEDFLVEEELGFNPRGIGNHCWLKVRKTGRDSADVSRTLSTLFGVSLGEIGMSGRKDRNAVTTQWFSIPSAAWGKSNQSLSAVNQQLDDGIEIIQAVRHDKKIKTGSHRANIFTLTIRSLTGDRGIAGKSPGTHP